MSILSKGTEMEDHWTNNPLKPWAPKQVREYAQQQRNKEEESPL